MQVNIIICKFMLSIILFWKLLSLYTYINMSHVWQALWSHLNNGWYFRESIVYNFKEMIRDNIKVMKITQWPCLFLLSMEDYVNPSISLSTRDHLLIMKGNKVVFIKNTKIECKRGYKRTPHPMFKHEQKASGLTNL